MTLRSSATECLGVISSQVARDESVYVASVLTRLRLLTLSLALCSSSFLACDEDDDEIGTPCEAEADCSEALVCDFHEGLGTCQHEHAH